MIRLNQQPRQSLWRVLSVLVVLVLPVWLAIRWKQHVDNFSQFCVEDPRVDLTPKFGKKDIENDQSSNPSGLIQPCDVFSNSYQQARQRFRDAALPMDGVQLFTLPVVKSKHNNNDRNSDETMDIAVVPGTAPGLVIHTSGTHGVEGFAGSAIQIAHLMQLQNMASLPNRTTVTTTAVADTHTPMNNQPTHRPTVVLVHAVNPWGMKRFRRTNENNVDLNRNALTPEQWKKALHHHVNHAAYQELYSFFNPSQPHTSTWSHLWLVLRGLALYLWYGDRLKAAIVGGQYYDPKGISYGGSGQLEPSWRILEDWLTDFLQSRSKTEAVTWIDVHTGLGNLGVDTYLFHPAAYETVEQVQTVVEDVQTHFPGLQTPLAGISQHATEVMKGYDNTMGLCNTYFLKLFQPEQKAIIGAQEIGTLPPAFVVHAGIVENAARQHLSVVEGLQWAERTTKRAFYPDSAVWRKEVLTRGTRVLHQAIARSASLSPPE